jgi:hypothetical protein
VRQRCHWPGRHLVLSDTLSNCDESRQRLRLFVFAVNLQILLRRSPPPPVSSRSISSSAEMASFCATVPLPLASASCACVGTASATFASARFLQGHQHTGKPPHLCPCVGQVKLAVTHRHTIIMQLSQYAITAHPE